MKKPIQISIPTPCHENWDAMIPADKGRFCASCQKNVIDFTKSSDREIASILKNTKNACGRFRITQLDRDLVVPKEKSTIWMAASAAVVSFLTIGNHAVSAQTPVNTEQHISETDDIKSITPIESPFMIKGVVMDNTGMPMPFSKITIRNSNVSTETDFDGKFSLKVNQGDVLMITEEFFKLKYVTIIKTQELKVKLEEDGSLPQIIVGMPEY